MTADAGDRGLARGGVRLLAAEEIRAASELLAHAFRNDPLMAHLVADEAQQSSVGPALYAASLRLALRCGAVVANEGPLCGVAAWLPPGAMVLADDVEAAGGAAIAALLGPTGAARLEELTEATGACRQRLVPEPHQYLCILGVDPELQGRGCGSALVRAGLERARGEGVRTYLETTNAANVAFYQRHGFEVAEAFATPSGLRVWAMETEE